MSAFGSKHDKLRVLRNLMASYVDLCPQTDVYLPSFSLFPSKTAQPFTSFFWNAVAVAWKKVPLLYRQIEQGGLAERNHNEAFVEFPSRKFLFPKFYGSSTVTHPSTK